MAITQNPDQVFVHTGRISWATLTTAQTSRTGTGSTSVFSAASEGSLLNNLIAAPHGANVATVLRIFINNGTTKSLINEVSLPAIAAASETEAKTIITIPCFYMLPTGYSVEVSIGTTVAAGWQITARGGDY